MSGPEVSATADTKPMSGPEVSVTADTKPMSGTEVSDADDINPVSEPDVSATDGFKPIAKPVAGATLEGHSLPEVIAADDGHPIVGPDVDAAEIKHSASEPELNPTDNIRESKPEVNRTYNINMKPEVETRACAPSVGDDDDRESRLYILDRSGSGHVTIIRLDKEKGLSGVDPGTDLENQTWNQIQGLKDYGTTVAENKIYILGGYNTESKICSMRMRRYDPVLDVWEEMPTMSMGRTQAAACTQDDQSIFVIGGHKQDGKPTKSCEVFDTGDRKWNKGGVMPAARKHHACAADTNHVFVSGGHSGKKAHRNLWIYEKHSWQELDEDYPTGISQNLERHCMIYFEHTLYFLGGITYERRTVPLHDPKTDAPARSTAKIIPHVQNKVESFKFHVKSGENRHVEEDELLDHFISPWDWNLPTMSCPRHSAGCFVHGRKIYLVGGTAPDGKPVRDVECFNLDDQTWTTLFRLPKGDYQNVTCLVVKFPAPKSSLQMLGGKHGANCEDKYSKLRWIMW